MTSKPSFEGLAMVLSSLSETQGRTLKQIYEIVGVGAGNRFQLPPHPLRRRARAIQRAGWRQSVFSYLISVQARYMVRWVDHLSSRCSQISWRYVVPSTEPWMVPRSLQLSLRHSSVNSFIGFT